MDAPIGGASRTPTTHIRSNPLTCGLFFGSQLPCETALKWRDWVAPQLASWSTVVCYHTFALGDGPANTSASGCVYPVLPSTFVVQAHAHHLLPCLIIIYIYSLLLVSFWSDTGGGPVPAWVWLLFVVDRLSYESTVTGKLSLECLPTNVFVGGAPASSGSQMGGGPEL